MHVCVCLHLHCSSLNCWRSVFKVSCFSSKRKYVDLHLFFLPVLFRWPHLHSWGEETISKHKVQTRVSNSDLTRHTWILLTSPSITLGKILKWQQRVISAGGSEVSLSALCFLPAEQLVLRVLMSYKKMSYKPFLYCVKHFCTQETWVCSAFDVATASKGQIIKAQELCGSM